MAEVPVPEPGPGQVRVRVAASVVHPVDLMIRSGRFPAPLPTGLPYTPGWDAAGTVDAVGPSVAGFTIGDEVIGFSPWLQTTVGAHAEYVVLDAAWLTSAPAGVPATAAATLPTNGLAAAQALDLLALPAGSTVLVTGAAGQVGGFVLALARAAGLHATGLAGAGDREFVESLGAAYLSRSDTPTGTFDAVIDLAVVGPALLDLVRDGGGYVAASPPLRPEPVRGIRTFALEVLPDGARLAELVKLVDSGDIPLRVADVYPFTDAAAAHERLAQGGHRGGVVLVP
ncbi:NADP-dependent oxidoreductase [Dactylosporangium sp. NBC_01737]|uniref:NADP-dependent oxidoreductase n=1 Tax=Dactylosporangium sp. NBC_01737 TaxID=2975959 RepID=UPI002E145477|nr:NADP-dependent oxidoreductase [Dactylosporangium sp. NBC_01737]